MRLNEGKQNQLNFREMKQTAVEWLIEQCPRIETIVAYNILEQAKEMEKEQQGYSEVIEFAEWIRIKDFQTTSKDNWIGLNMKYYTTKELFEIFKTKEK
jgi:hypothetical protein